MTRNRRPGDTIAPLTGSKSPTSRKSAARQGKHARKRNVFSEILTLGHDEDFCPKPAADPTTAMPGSAEKLRVMAQRVQNGQDIHHPEDRLAADGGVVNSRTSAPLRVFLSCFNSSTRDASDDGEG